MEPNKKESHLNTSAKVMIELLKVPLLPSLCGTDVLCCTVLMCNVSWAMEIFTEEGEVCCNLPGYVHYEIFMKKVRCVVICLDMCTMKSSLKKVRCVVICLDMCTMKSS